MPEREKKKPASRTPPNGSVEKLRINRAFQLAVFGLTLSAVLAVVLLFHDSMSAAEITALVGLFTSVLGTLVGAFFGLQIGSADKAKAEERADAAQEKADKLQHLLADQSTITRARKMYPDLFK
jgi:hypothetical protein